MPEVVECAECERLEQAYIRPRDERSSLLLGGGRLTQADDKRLTAEEQSALYRLKEHRATALKQKDSMPVGACFRCR
jgi:hypothetical protein